MVVGARSVGGRWKVSRALNRQGGEKCLGGGCAVSRALNHQASAGGSEWF